MEIKTDNIIYIIYSIREKIDRYIHLELKNKNIIGLVPIHGSILLALHNDGPLTMKKIAETVNRKKSTVTTLVGKLIKLGYAEKKINEKDKRSFKISLSDEGFALIDTLIHISRQVILNLYKDMPHDERIYLKKTLNKLNSGW